LTTTYQRRRIPAQAFALKKYRGGTLPASKTSDNEQTPSSLRDGPWKAVDSDKLSVKNAVGEPIPELPHCPEEGSKRPSVVNRQEAGHVLKNQPLGPKSASKRQESERQVATLVIHAAALTGDGEGLAGSAPDQKVN
jgi:hypothetical protein